MKHTLQLLLVAPQFAEALSWDAHTESITAWRTLNRALQVCLARKLTPHPSRDGWRKRRRGTRSPQGEGCVSDFGTLGVQPKMWEMLSPEGEGCSATLDACFKWQPSPWGEGARRRRAGEGSFRPLKPEISFNLRIPAEFAAEGRRSIPQPFVVQN